MGKSKLKFKKYFAGLLLVLVISAFIGLIKIGNFDKLAGKVKIEDARLTSAKAKLNASIFDITTDNAITSNGYDEINYELKYKLSEAEVPRDVIIEASLNDDERYASFKRITGDNITSELSNNNRKITITISNVTPNTEITTNIAMLINGAPDGYSVNPRVRIKESTSEAFADINTNPVEVSTNNLRGIVRNEENREISNIIISLYQNRQLVKETYTNSNGEYMFSDIPAGEYTVKINEDIYEDTQIDGVIVDRDSTLDLLTERIYPFKLEVHKYITKVDAYNNGALTSRTYDDLSTVNFPVANLGLLNGKVYYKIVVENTGKKSGVVSLIKDELPKFMSFNEEENSGFELKDGIIYDRNLEGITLYPGEKREDTLILNIVDTKEARTYLNRVNANGEIYEHVVYLLDGQTYKEEDVLEGEQIVRPTDPIESFGGWYTDSKYTNLYNFNNPVTKDLVLYGKTAQKYNVEFYDKDPETGDETLYTEEEVPGGDPVDEPEDHPEHPGYDFDYWCTVDNVKYIFTTPVTEDLKLITCYTIQEFDVNFYNYDDTIEKTTQVEYKHYIDETEAPTFDETGYTFLCWSRDKTNCFDFTTPITEDIDLYPTHEKLKNAVVFNDENRITTVEVPYGDTTNPIDDQGKEGHTFSCWSEDRTNCFDFNTPIIQNTTVYAIYDINHFTVSFIDRDPEGIEEDTSYGEVQTVEWNGTATKPTPDPTHTGYTFSEWTKEDGTTYNFETPVTSNLILISTYNINSYPVRFHNDNDVTTVSVEYKHKVTPIDNPTKEHHIFTYWSKNDLPFDFDTLIVEETDLYSNFEEILPPVIAHTPTMWTNGNVTVTVSKNASLADDTGYSYLYKEQDGEYNTYSEPFIVTENKTVIAKARKSNVDSEVVNDTIVNIDKLNPSITDFSENAVNKNAVTLNVNSIDNESGINYYEIYQDNVKVGEKHFECYNETTFDGYEECRRDLPAERVDTYTVTGLTPSTTYTFKVKVYDKAGNQVTSNDIEVTTSEPYIVARLIGYNDQPLQEENYINFESLAEAFAYGSESADLYDCQTVQCTIQMVRSTNESVQVLDTQDLTLDLNGKIVSGVNAEYTIKNNGDFVLTDYTPEANDSGKLVNTLGTAILNKTGSSLTLGEGYSDHEDSSSFVSVTRPYIYGSKVGIKVENNSNFTMYDGKIVAPSSQIPGEGAVSGRVDATEYGYEAVSNSATIDDVNHQVITLSQLTDPEARVNTSLYFNKLSSAISTANKGTSYIESEESNLMEDIERKGTYYFEYDPVTGHWVSNNDVSSTTATSVINIDLTNSENDKILVVDYLINPASNGSNGSERITVTDYINHGKTTGTTTYNVFGVLPNEKIWYLEKGKNYALNLTYYQAYINTYYQTTPVELGNMEITNITLSDLAKGDSNASKNDSIVVRDDDFYYDEDTNTIRSSNQYICQGNSTVYSSTEIDLTNKEGDYELIVNASLEDNYANNYTYSYIFVDENDNLDIDRYNNVLLSFQSSSGYEYYTQDNAFYIYGPMTGKMILQGGKKYYMKLINRKTGGACVPKEEYDAHNNSDQLIIHSMDLIKVSDESEVFDVYKRSTRDTLLDDYVANSNGQFIELPDGTISTQNIAANQTSTTNAVFDLTNDEQGGRLEILAKSTEAEDGTKVNISASTVNVYRHYIKDGEELRKKLNTGGNTYVDEDGYTVIPYNLPGGYKYTLETQFTSQNKGGMSSYSNLVFKEISYKKLDTFEGNNFNGIYNQYSGSSSPNVVMSSNVLDYNKIHDSYVKIDLTGYDKNQLLSFNTEFYDVWSYSRYFVYLTNNNRALTQEEIHNNRGNLYTYVGNNNKWPYYRSLYPGASYQSSYSPSNDPGSAESKFYQQHDLVLEKGQVYYLHFASLNINPDGAGDGYYGNQSFRLYDLRLTPILESVLNYGGTNIYTGTVDVSGKTEESYNTQTRDASFEPVEFSKLPLYDYVLNEETGMYEPQNVLARTAAAVSIKVDLTTATEDKNYMIITNGSGYYAIGDEDNIPQIETATLIRGDGLQKYKSFSSSVNNLFTLEKGKIYYIQFANYVYSDSPNNPTSNAFKIEEYKFENETNNYDKINDIREFNEEVDTVQLLKDVVVSDKPATIDYEQEVVLDLNGYNLSTTSQNYVVDNSGDLTIIDSKNTNQAIDAGTNVYEYNYGSSYQSFTAPESGLYTIEAWGAEGGYAYNEENHGGYGGYAKGQVFLDKNQRINFYVGQKGTDANLLTNRSYNYGRQDADYGFSNSNEQLGAGGGSTLIYADTTTTYAVTDTSAANVLLDAAGGGGAYATNFSSDETPIPSTQIIGGNADDLKEGIIYSIVNNAAGQKGSGGGYYRANSLITGDSGSGGESYASPILIDGSTYINTENEASEEPIANTYKKGNGFVRITLDKVSNGTISTTKSNGTVINNQEKAKLTIKTGKYSISGNGKVISNSGDLILDGSSIINVGGAATGIENLQGGTITTTNGISKIILNNTNCGGQTNSIGIKLGEGDYDLTNINISGKNGVGILTDSKTNLNLHSSSIVLNETSACKTQAMNNASDATETSDYDKNFTYYYKYYNTSYYYDRLDGPILNNGNTVVDNGSILSGRINNAGGVLELTGGTKFNDIYQKNGTSIINKVLLSFNNQWIYNEGGIMNFGKSAEDSSYDIKTTNILNTGTMNVYEGNIAGLLNLGTLNTYNATFDKLYNLNTYIDKRPNAGGNTGLSLYRGTANLNGGTVKTNPLINESVMTVNGTTVETGIINRKDLTVKGNSNIIGNEKTAIQMVPFTYTYERLTGIVNRDNPTYVAIPTSLTIGDDDGTVTATPSIKTTNNTFTITGNCYGRYVRTYNNIPYREFVDDYITFYKYNNKVYRASPNFLAGTSQEGLAIPEYYMDRTLCDFKYYDGTIENGANTYSQSAFNVTDLGMSNIPSGYDMKFDLKSDNGGVITLDTLNSSARPAIFDVNGTPAKSLEAAIALVPDNTPTTIIQNGSYTTAHQVTVPSSKQIVYELRGQTVPFSTGPFITNNGELETRSGNIMTVGQVEFENNGTLTINGSTSEFYAQYFRQGYLLKNNGTATINNSVSLLDIIDKGNLTLNSGANLYNSVIKSYGSNVVMNSPKITNGAMGDDNMADGMIFYRENDENLKTYNSYSFFNSKPTFKAYKNEEGTPSTITVNGLNSESNFFFGEFNSSTLNLNIPDTSMYYWLNNTFINGNGTVNVLQGNYNAGHNFKVSGTYNQQSGNVVGTVTLGTNSNANIISGTLTSSDNTEVISLGNNNKVTVGVKGDGSTSKTDPVFNCSDYCFGNVNDTVELNFYDGIFKGNITPVNVAVNEIEEGYSLINNRKKSPKETYLDILPVIYNYTKDISYFDIQEAFNAADSGDELILLRDYSNNSSSESIVVAQDKNFKLYLNYILSIDASDNMTYTPYKEGDTIADINDLETPIITINNTDILDNNGNLVTEVPFIINNGNLTIYGSTYNDIPSLNSNKNANFVDNSGARIIVNNGTLTMNEVSAISSLGSGSMFKNTGTMNVRRGKFETNINTVFDNNLGGIINIVQSSSDTNTCYNPTYIKVIDENVPTYEPNAVHNVKPTINNNGTIDITYLYMDADYAYKLIYNTGTMNIDYSSFEQVNIVTESGTSKYAPLKTNYFKGIPSIDNIGIININHTTGVLLGSIKSNNTLDIKNSQLATYRGSTIVNETGKLNVEDTDIYSSYTGIDNNNTIYDITVKDTNIKSKTGIIGQTSTAGKLTIDGGTYISNRTSEIQFTSNPMISSCSNNTPTTISISEKIPQFVPTNGYTPNSGIFTTNTDLTIKDANIEFTGTFVPYKGTKFEAGNALVRVENGSLLLEGSTLDHKNNSYVTALRTIDNDVTIIDSIIPKYTNDSNSNIVNIGVKDNNNADGPKIDSILCSADNTSGINLYDGYVYVNNDNLCSFADKENGYNIIGENNKRYLSTDNFIKNIRTDTPYNSIATAIADASNGDTLQLIKDLSLISVDKDVLVDGKNIIFDLAGFNTNANIILENNAELTLTDSVRIADSSKSRGRLGSIINTSGTLTVNEGYVTNINNTGNMSITSGEIETINTISGTITGGRIKTISHTGNLSVSNTIITSSITNNGGSLIINNVTKDDAINRPNLYNRGAGIVDITNSELMYVYNYDTSSITINDNATKVSTLYNYTTTPITLNNGIIGTIYNKSNLTLSGAAVNNIIYNTGNITITSGSINAIYNSANGNITLNEGTVRNIVNKYTFCNPGYSNCFLSEYDEDFNVISFNGGHDTSSSASYYYEPTVTINGGTVSETISNRAVTTILGGTVGQVNMKRIIRTSSDSYGAHYDATLTIGSKDGTVSTASPIINNQSGYAITTDQGSYYVKLYFYDGRIVGSSPTTILNGEITDMETNYVPTIVPDYDEHGDLTGTYSMILKLRSETDTKIACVNGICYSTLQEAIDASVQNYDEETGCPIVTIGDEIFFSVELDDDLILDPQYTVTIDLNHHNINDNGHTIPNNIVLTNGSRNGHDINSSLARFLSNVFGSGDISKDIIVTKLEDGNALDTAKTYKLYKYENGAYLPIKVDSNGAGNYTLGKETTDMKSIKGRLYINGLPNGEYIVKDNYDNELEFTIYDDGTLTPNVKENIASEYGHLSASAVATLIISIQTGIIRVRYILIILLILGTLTTLLLLKKNKSKKKETI